MALIEQGDCEFEGTVAPLKGVLDGVAEAMPRLTDAGGAVRIEACRSIYRALDVVARDAEGVVRVRMPFGVAYGAMVALLSELRAEITRLLAVAGSGEEADNVLLESVGGKAKVTVGGGTAGLTWVALSQVDSVVTSPPPVGTVVAAELLAVAERAREAGDGRGVLVRVGGGDLTFGGFAPESLIAKVKVTSSSQLGGDVKVFRVDPDRVVAIARRFGSSPIDVGFTFVDGGASVCVALVVSADVHELEIQLHGTPVVA
jgi:hypothetical protein